MVDVVIIGAGQRGHDVYAKLLSEYEDVNIKAVAEKDPKRLKRFVKTYDIPGNLAFNNWEELFKSGIKADGAIISTMDNMHVGPAVEAIRNGYDLLLEKPIATNMEDIMKITNLSAEKGKNVIVAHVLRYTPFFAKLKAILSTGIIGKVIGINLNEKIGYFHFAHSYVRGNWRNTTEACPSILAKNSHDMDILCYLMDSKCDFLSSSGSLHFFKGCNSPEDSAERCLDCPSEIEKRCPYSAKKIYLGDSVEWPVSVISDDLSYEGRKNALKYGQYGRCVFKCDNNVADHQTVNMRFENGVDVSFTMSAFTQGHYRSIRIFGSEGEIFATLGKTAKIEIKRFVDNVDLNKVVEISHESGHGGGDRGIVEHFIKTLKKENNTSLSSVFQSVESHLMALSAEKSRLENGVLIDMAVEREKYGIKK